jgi:hypothetical protein
MNVSLEPAKSCVLADHSAPAKTILPDRRGAPRNTSSTRCAAAGGTDPTAFERAVGAAFEPLGFKAAHVGGTMNPDGYLDAMLGPLGYRVMLECKSSAKPLMRADVYEAAKYRDQYGA